MIHKRPFHRAFTLVEILVVLGVLCLLVALLFPIFASVRRKAQDSSCLNNLHQLGLSLQLYTDDYDGRYPRALSPHAFILEHDPLLSDEDFRKIPVYTKILKPYVKSPLMFRCPIDDGAEFYGKNIPNLFEEWETSYIYNRLLTGEFLISLEQINSMNPSQVSLLQDGGDWHDNGATPATSPDKYVQVVYADLHATRVRVFDIEF